MATMHSADQPAVTARVALDHCLPDLAYDCRVASA
jgi:hypothetical protein